MQGGALYTEDYRKHMQYEQPWNKTAAIRYTSSRFGLAGF